MLRPSKVTRTVKGHNISSGARRLLDINTAKEFSSKHKSSLYGIRLVTDYHLNLVLNDDTSYSGVAYIVL